MYLLDFTSFCYTCYKACPYNEVYDTCVFACERSHSVCEHPGLCQDGIVVNITWVKYFCELAVIRLIKYTVIFIDVNFFRINAYHQESWWVMNTQIWMVCCYKGHYFWEIFVLPKYCVFVLFLHVKSTTPWYNKIGTLPEICIDPKEVDIYEYDSVLN